MQKGSCYHIRALAFRFALFNVGAPLIACVCGAYTQASSGGGAASAASSANDSTSARKVVARKRRREQVCVVVNNTSALSKMCVFIVARQMVVHKNRFLLLYLQLTRAVSVCMRECACCCPCCHRCCCGSYCRVIVALNLYALSQFSH